MPPASENAAPQVCLVCKRGMHTVEESRPTIAQSTQNTQTSLTLLYFQDELALSLKVLQDKVESLKKIQETSAEFSKYIKVM